MTPIEQGLRRFLYLGALAVGLGVPAELLLAEHTGSAVQLVPFVLCGLLVAAVGAAWGAPSRGSLRAAAGVAALVGVGAAFGAWEHLEHNFAFAAEIDASMPVSGLVVEALFGASPPLAPGALAVGGALLFAATWRHPSLGAKGADANQRA